MPRGDKIRKGPIFHRRQRLKIRHIGSDEVTDPSEPEPQQPGAAGRQDSVILHCEKNEEGLQSVYRVPSAFSKNYN